MKQKKKQTRDQYKTNETKTKKDNEQQRKETRVKNERSKDTWENES